MAHVRKRSRGHASKTHSSSASNPKIVKTDKAKGSSEVSFTIPKGVPFSYAETSMHQFFAKMSQSSHSDPRAVRDAEKLSIEWDDVMAFYLEDHLLESLFGAFVRAIRQIVACGYSVKEAEYAVLKSGLYYGIRNPILNVVNGALIFLEMAKDFGTSEYQIFDNVGKLVQYLLVEMIYILKEAKPSLTVVEAMWGLMVCNLDLEEAYEVDGGTLRTYSALGHEMCETLFAHPRSSHLFQDSQPPTSSSQGGSESDAPHSPYSFRRSSYPGKGASVSDPRSRGNPFYQYLSSVGERSVMDKKDGSKKGSFSASNRDMPRKNQSHLDKHDKNQASADTLVEDVSAWVPMALGKRLKYPNSASSNTNRIYSKISSVAGKNLPVVTVCQTSFTTRLPMDKYMPGLPASRPKANSKNSPGPSDILVGIIPYDKSSGKYVPRDEKDETILSLATRVQMLKDEHQRLTDWANENVMQAAQRLRKDQAELKALSEEKETMVKSERDKQHVSEMEYAVARSDGHMKMASSTTSQLEEENSVLKEELEAAKLQVRSSSANLQEALMREQEALKRAQSCEGKKSLLREELSANKRKVAELEIALEKAKGFHSQIEVRCKQEEIEKEKLLAEARYIAHEREQLKSLAEMEEEAFRESAETELQKGKAQIKSLETKLFELKLNSDSSKLSQVRRKVKGSCGGAKVVRMERECVMCMTEEKSVVFLPCAHQSLCERCNKLHDEQGMKDCPSCRTPIKRRIKVKFANP